MPTRFKLLAAIACSVLGLTATSSLATVTLQFSQTGVARATGFANQAGAATNGMNWGVVIDSTGNGFSGGYDVFSSTASGFLSVGSVATDDYYVTTGLLTSTQSATGTDPGGVGGITSLANIFATYPTGVNAGDAFRIVWFDGTPTAGSYYGMMSDAGFVLPSDGNTTSFASIFNNGTSADPLKPANLQFPGAAPVPEPSRMMLLGFGLIGLFFRRRR